MPRNLTKDRQAYDALAEAIRHDHQKWKRHAQQKKRALRSALLAALIAESALAALIFIARNQQEISAWLKM